MREVSHWVTAAAVLAVVTVSASGQQALVGPKSRTRLRSREESRGW